MPPDLFTQFFRGLNRADENYVTDDRLTGDVVFGSHHSGFGDRGVVDQSALNLGGRNAVA